MAARRTLREAGCRRLICVDTSTADTEQSTIKPESASWGGQLYTARDRATAGPLGERVQVRKTGFDGRFAAVGVAMGRSLRASAALGTDTRSGTQTA